MTDTCNLLSNLSQIKGSTYHNKTYKNGPRLNPSEFIFTKTLYGPMKLTIDKKTTNVILKFIMQIKKYNC